MEHRPAAGNGDGPPLEPPGKPHPGRPSERHAARALRLALIAPGLLLLALLVAPLLASETALATRDVATFHLPLRSAFQQLVAAEGLPEWNPWIHAGQPVLSNPNYAPFYPPTWAALPLAPHRALGLLAALHVALAFAGAWLLVRRLGGEAAAAALGATSFAGGGFFLSLTSTFNFLCGMAWFPWLLLAGERLLAAPRGRTHSPGGLLAAGLALQLFAGEPVASLITVIALGALALVHPEGAGRASARLAAAGGLALALAAVQLLPTLDRLGGTPRGRGIELAEATTWSMPPGRVVELVAPRFWGHPLRDEEGLYFGWEVHDHQFPYVVTLHSGMLAAILGLAALAAWPVPRRWGWALALGAGLFLALGRFNPLYGELHAHLPLLRVLRYPEKLAVLALAVLPFAAALGWQHLMAARRRGEVERSRLPLAMALVVALSASFVAGLLTVRPEVGDAFIRRHSGLPPSPATLERGRQYLRGEAQVTAAVAGGAALLFLLVPRRRVPELALGLGAVTLLALDLGHHGRDLIETAHADTLVTPPPTARAAADLGGRVYSPGRLDDAPEVHLRVGPVGQQQLLGRLARLDPYSASLWGLGYALHHDYDLMLTPWARHALELFVSAPSGREARWRILGAWDVASVVERRPLEEQVAELRRTGELPVPVTIEENPWHLPRFRFASEATWAADAEHGLRLLAQQGFDVTRGEICLGAMPQPEGPLAPGEILEVAEGGKRIRVRYRAPGPALLVAAVTWDEGWQATLGNGLGAPACPTALGQIGILVPPGEHTLELRYRDPWVRLGAAISALALLAGLLAVSRTRR